MVVLCCRCTGKAQQKKQIRSAAELDKRLEMISTQYRVGDLLLKLGGCQPRVPIPTELCILDVAFSPFTLPDVREAIRFRTVSASALRSQHVGTPGPEV